MDITRKWKKKPSTGRHVFTFNGVRFSAAPGQVVECSERSLGKQAKDYMLLGQSLKEVGESSQKELSTVPFIITPKGGGFYNIVNPDNMDKPFNDKPLRKKEALEFFNQISYVPPSEEIIEMAEETKTVRESLLDIPKELLNLEWDELVSLMEEEKIIVRPEYDTSEDLREAITLFRLNKR